MEGHSDCCMQNNFHTPKNTNGNKIIIKNTNIPFGPNDIFMVLVSFAHVSDFCFVVALYPKVDLDFQY